ncbi:MAG TPA: AI-2E family transporter, partial [Acidimicrobiia bacterium]|nr:AI-2E family transporter [Acidimicrobiia bacterium]
LAGALVFILNPVINFLQRRRVPRVAGVGLTYLGFATFVTLIGLVLFPAVQSQSENLSDKWPEIRDKIEKWVDDRAAALEGTPFEFDRTRLEEAVTSTDDSVRDQINLAADIGARIFHVLLVLILAPIFAFYLLVDLPHLKRTAEGLIPEGARDEVMLVAGRINRAVGGFFRGQLVVALIVGILSSIGLKIIDLPFWLLIGMVAGMFNIVPLVGPYIGGIPALVIALTTREPITAAWVVAIMVGVQQIDNHFISPVVMHRVVKLHPVIVMVALLLGGTLAGFFGLLIAVPAAAILKIVIGHLWRVHVLGQPIEQWAREARDDDETPGTGFVADVPATDGDPGGPGVSPEDPEPAAEPVPSS